MAEITIMKSIHQSLPIKGGDTLQQIKKSKSKKIIPYLSLI